MTTKKINPKTQLPPHHRNAVTIWWDRVELLKGCRYPKLSDLNNDKETFRNIKSEEKARAMLSKRDTRYIKEVYWYDKKGEKVDIKVAPLSHDFSQRKFEVV